VNEKRYDEIHEKGRTLLKQFLFQNEEEPEKHSNVPTFKD
jgi:hypothetical protein